LWDLVISCFCGKKVVPYKIATGKKTVEESIYNAELWHQIKEYAIKKG
jgi:hypothetical protein